MIAVIASLHERIQSGWCATITEYMYAAMYWYLSAIGLSLPFTVLPCCIVVFHVLRTFGSVLFLSLQSDQLQLRSDFHGRFLLAKEALMAQGMPVYADVLTQGVSMCVLSHSLRISENTFRLQEALTWARLVTACIP